MELYYKSKKHWPILYSYLLYKMGHGFLDKQSSDKETFSFKVIVFSHFFFAPSPPTQMWFIVPKSPQQKVKEQYDKETHSNDMLFKMFKFIYICSKKQALKCKITYNNNM